MKGFSIFFLISRTKMAIKALRLSWKVYQSLLDEKFVRSNKLWHEKGINIMATLSVEYKSLELTVKRRDNIQLLGAIYSCVISLAERVHMCSHVPGFVTRLSHKRDRVILWNEVVGVEMVIIAMYSSDILRFRFV